MTKDRSSNIFYYSQLDKTEQKAYFSIKTGLENLDTSFMVPRLSGSRLSDIYFMVRLDNPQIFYSVTFKYRYYEESQNVEMLPEYLFPKGKISEHRQAMETRIKKLVRQAEGLSEPEKELYVHDFVCGNVRYDKLKKAYSHEIIGPLGQGVGVCEGIAKAVKTLCDELGIWCIIAISENNPDKKIKYRHAWNVVRIEGIYYHLDVTFDNTLGSPDLIRHDYVNLSDGQFFRDHEPVIWQVPPCENGEHFYYRNKKLSFTKIEDVQKRAAQAVKKGKVFLFHWRGGYLTKGVFQEIVDVLKEEAHKKEKFVSLSLNWSQAVFQVSFKELPAQEEIRLEEANEGENQ